MNNLVTNIQGYSIHDGPGIRTVVFFKGCRLECRWCSNPECISPLPEVGFIKKLCTRCGKCAEVCSKGALSIIEGIPHIDRKLCSGCGDCSLICADKAIIQYGKPMNAEEIYNAVIKDKIFYDSSGGGVTVSGGEALLKPRLVYELFTECREAGIHTCIETSGCVSASAICMVLPVTNFVLFDLKLMDTGKHVQYTGQPNDLILSNARIIIENNTETLFRMPLIPGINDDLQNINDTAEFLHNLGNNACRIELMPYHQLGKGKYESLDRNFNMPDISLQKPEQLELIKQIFEDSGINCKISR